MSGVGKAPVDTSAGYKALAILLPLFVLALASYIARIWNRVRPKLRLNAADYTLTIAVVRIMGALGRCIRWS